MGGEQLCQSLGVFLRVLRVVFIVAGLALMGVGTFMIAETKATGGQAVATWTCEPDEPKTSGRSTCTVTQMSYTGPGSLGDVVMFAMLPLMGVGLIGAAVALGQFERPRTGRPWPAQPPAMAGPPLAQSGQQRWPGQPPS